MHYIFLISFNYFYFFGLFFLKVFLILIHLLMCRGILLVKYILFYFLFHLNYLYIQKLDLYLILIKEIQIEIIKHVLTRIPKKPIGRKTIVIKKTIMINFTVGLMLCQNDFLFMYLSKAFCIITPLPPY